eukprot:1416716-Prymnesium_polylepis.1
MRGVGEHQTCVRRRAQTRFGGGRADPRRGWLPELRTHDACIEVCETAERDDPEAESRGGETDRAADACGRRESDSESQYVCALYRDKGPKRV